MTSNRATPDEAADGCPKLDAVNAVLDREASDEMGRALRRHVAACVACSERFGALFEVDSLAPAVARAPLSVRRITRLQPWLAAAALLVAAALLFFLRARDDRPRDVAQAGKPSAPPRLVASRRVETEIVVDSAGVHASIRHAGAGGAGSFDYATSRDGRTSFAWTRLPAAPIGAGKTNGVSPTENSR
jgi:hypothetical protein